jgi:DNA polymerase-4
LRRLGYKSLGDLANADAQALERVLGTWGREIRELARGNDAREVEPSRDAKSIGAECTYEEDLTTKAAIARTLLAHASRVAERLTENGLLAGGVLVKLKYADFSLLSRQLTLPDPASDTQTLHEACLRLLDRFPLDGARVRLTGVAAQDLRHAADLQPVLFPDRAAERRRAAESVLLLAKDRYGGQAITFATLLESSERLSTPKGDPSRLSPRRRRAD